VKKVDVTTITQLIGSLGFPIVCCAALFWYMVKEKDAHKAEMEELRKSVEANTQAINHLCEHLGGENNAED
jgi:hypothetical protein